MAICAEFSNRAVAGSLPRRGPGVGEAPSTPSPPPPSPCVPSHGDNAKASTCRALAVFFLSFACRQTHNKSAAYVHPACERACEIATLAAHAINVSVYAATPASTGAVYAGCGLGLRC